MANPGRIVSIDIETTTEVEGAPDGVVPGLDPRYGAVTDVGIVVVEPDGRRTGTVISVGSRQPVARYVNGRTVLAPDPDAVGLQVDGFDAATLDLVATEHDLLARTAERLRSLAAGPDDLVVGWNTAVFDLPFLHDRMRTWGDIVVPFTLTADPSVYVKYDPLPGHAGGYRAQFGVSRTARHLDIQSPFKAWAEARGVRHSLKPVAVEAGYSPIEVDASRMHLLSQAERVAYVLSDADVTASLALEFTDELDLTARIDAAA